MQDVALGTPPTVLEAGWHGNLVLEFSNHTSNSIRFMLIVELHKFCFFKENSQKFLMQIEKENIKAKLELL